MKIDALLLAIAGVVAVSIVPVSASSRAPCADFNAYKGGDTLDPITKVGDLEVSSYPANRIRIYDPADDRGPEKAIGAEIRNRLSFETASGRFGIVRLRYVSNSPGGAFLSIVDRRGLVLQRTRLDPTPQNTVLTKEVKGLRSAAGIMLDHPGEVFVSRVCFAR